MPNALNFWFLSYCNLKENIFHKKVNSKKKYVYMWSIIIFLICQKLWSVRPLQQKIKLPLPKERSVEKENEHKREYWRNRYSFLFFVWYCFQDTLSVFFFIVQIWVEFWHSFIFTLQISKNALEKSKSQWLTSSVIFLNYWKWLFFFIIYFLTKRYFQCKNHDFSKCCE